MSLYYKERGRSCQRVALNQPRAQIMARHAGVSEAAKEPDKAGGVEGHPPDYESYK